MNALPLLVEDANSAVWAILPAGRIVEISAEAIAAGRAGIEKAIAEDPSLPISYLERRESELEPFSIVELVACPICEGRGHTERLVKFELNEPDRRGENEYWSAVGPFDGELDDLSSGEAVALSAWDCENECGSDGTKLEPIGIECALVVDLVYEAFSGARRASRLERIAAVKKERAQFDCQAADIHDGCGCGRDRSKP